MIKSKYILSQEGCCKPTSNFTIHESVDNDNHNQQQSGFSQMNFAPQQNVGAFVSEETTPFCCSCKGITRLSLQLYGQQLSLGVTMTNCLINTCAGQLVVYSHSKVILGKIKKTCSAYCSPSVMVIEDQSKRDIFSLNMRCCQMANCLPRVLNLCGNTQYEVLNSKGELVATITNVHRNCKTSCFTLQDDFHLTFLSVDKEKEKILLLNAVVYLNLMRHEWF